MSLAFAIHLAKTGTISNEQLVDAIEQQVASRPQLGQLALQDGLLSMSQLFEVLSVQRLEEKPFGQIAIERGFLSTAQLAVLLMKQSEMEFKLCDLLVELGAIKPADLSALHLQWKQDNRCRDTFVSGRSALRRLSEASALQAVTSN
jgi:hypothetical protein